MLIKNCENIVKTLLFMVVFWLLISCSNNGIDKLLKEAEVFINKKDHIELFEQLISDDTSINIKAMAELTRFMIVIEELENQRLNMTVKQLEKYLLLSVDAMRIVGELELETANTKVVVSDPDSPYVSRSPEYSYYNDIGTLTIKTKDYPESYSVTVEIVIGYDLGNQNASQELISRRYELRDFVRRYFSGKTAVELVPEREEELKKEIREQLNTRFLDIARARIIIFNRLDVIKDI